MKIKVWNVMYVDTTCPVDSMSCASWATKREAVDDAAERIDPYDDGLGPHEKALFREFLEESDDLILVVDIWDVRVTIERDIVEFSD